MDHSKTSIIIGILCAFLFITTFAFGVLWYQARQQLSAANEQLKIFKQDRMDRQINNTSALDTSTWQTYHNKKDGFTVKYPSTTREFGNGLRLASINGNEILLIGAIRLGERDFKERSENFKKTLGWLGGFKEEDLLDQTAAPLTLHYQRRDSNLVIVLDEKSKNKSVLFGFRESQVNQALLKKIAETLIFD